MKLTTTILLLGMAGGTALGQNPDVIQDTRDTMKALQQKQTIDSNAALNSQPPASGQHIAAQQAARSPQAAAAPKVAHGGKAKPKAAVAKKSRPPKENVSVESNAPPAEEQASAQAKSVSLTGRRDPFLSPVVQQAMVGSGCSTGKKCLAVDQIVLKGVVRSDAGMIAVVVNAVDKAYFLRENDPIFNGYVVKITGDSVIFRETIHDKLGKPFTRDVTKKITTPAV